MSDDDYNRVGPIVAERHDDDELPPGSPRHGGRKRPIGDRSDESTKNTASDQRSGRSSGAGRMAVVVLLLAVVGLAAYAIHLNQQNTETRTALDNLQARFDHLEDQIMSTDESLSESGAAIQAKLREVDSEIRKLWGVSNDRNRKAISANEEAIKGLTASVGAIEQSQASQRGTVDSLRSSVDSLGNKVNGFERSIGNANAEVLAAKAEIEQIRQRLRTLDAAAERINSTVSRVNSLDNKVRNHEEAIQSIDAFRRQTNQSLLQIRQQLGVQ